MSDDKGARRFAQILIEEIGADGPESAEETARRAVALLRQSGDRLEAWELTLAAHAVYDAIGQWALALGSRNDLMTLWSSVPPLACEAIVAVVTLRSKDICLALASRGEFATAAFLAEVNSEWNHYRYDFINAVMKHLEIKYEL